MGKEMTSWSRWERHWPPADPPVWVPVPSHACSRGWTWPGHCAAALTPVGSVWLLTHSPLQYRSHSSGSHPSLFALLWNLVKQGWVVCKGDCYFNNKDQYVIYHKIGWVVCQGDYCFSNKYQCVIYHKMFLNSIDRKLKNLSKNPIHANSDACH